MASSNKRAQTLKSLHVPGKPIVIANVYDILSARAVAALPSAKALGTASFAVARAFGTEDNDLTLETNLNAVAGIGKVAMEADKPLTVDLQDGYGSHLEEAISGSIERGAVGCNIEDCDKESGKMYAPELAASRVKKALETAKTAGVPDFVVNARCDTLVTGGGMDEVIERGKLYLEAGATTIFVWGGGRGVSKAEIERMVTEFKGRLNVMLRVSGEDALTIAELGDIGVARVSVGPQIQIMAMKHLAQIADGLLKSGST